MKKEIEKFFEEEFEAFENDDILDFCYELLDTAPTYLFEIPASTTGKYHPSYSLGFMGLARHVKAATKFLNYMLSIDCIKNKFTSRERDLMRTAIMNHDDEKLGRNGSQYTVFKHPLLIAERIKSYKGFEWLPDEELDYIADCCASHMGQFNTDTRSKTILPLPVKNEQILVHLSDYLASRKDVEVLFNDEIYELADSLKPTPETYLMPFGKYKGEPLSNIPDSYLGWLNDQNPSEPLKSLLADALGISGSIFE